jgi:hypothetical protein
MLIFLRENAIWDKLSDPSRGKTPSGTNCQTQVAGKGHLKQIVRPKSRENAIWNKDSFALQIGASKRKV